METDVIERNVNKKIRQFRRTLEKQNIYKTNQGQEFIMELLNEFGWLQFGDLRQRKIFNKIRQFDYWCLNQ